MTVVMTFLVIEVVEAESDLVVEVDHVVTIVAVLERQVSENAGNESHKHKPTSKIALLNSDKMYGEQSIFIVIAKEKMVVVTKDISIKFYFSLFIKI